MDELSDSSDVCIKLEPGDFSDMDTFDSELPRKKRTDWDNHNTALLIKFWRKHLPTLRREKRHSKTLEEIREKLNRYGVRKTISEIKSKMKNLQSKYRTEKKRMKDIPSYKTNWVFYDDIHTLSLNLRPSSSSLDPLGLDDADFLQNGDSNSNPSIVSLEPLMPEEKPKVMAQPEPPPSVSLPPKRPVERRLASVHEDLLEEIKRSNAVSERSEERMYALLEEANEIAREQLRITKELLEKLIK
ncbi:hypothetical protein DMENIID0001_077160 [Sergentomyia squamirostris]